MLTCVPLYAGLQFPPVCPGPGAALGPADGTLKPGTACPLFLALASVDGPTSGLPHLSAAAWLPLSDWQVPPLQGPDTFHEQRQGWARGDGWSLENGEVQAGLV